MSAGNRFVNRALFSTPCGVRVEEVDSIDRITDLVTDRAASPETLQPFEAAGLRVITA